MIKKITFSENEDFRKMIIQLHIRLEIALFSERILSV